MSKSKIPRSDVETLRLKVGDKVRKISGKPFKSGKWVGTIAGVTINPHTQLPAFTFAEDDSVVDMKQCRKTELA